MSADVNVDVSADPPRIACAFCAGTGTVERVTMFIGSHGGRHDGPAESCACPMCAGTGPTAITIPLPEATLQYSNSTLPITVPPRIVP